MTDQTPYEEVEITKRVGGGLVDISDDVTVTDEDTVPSDDDADPAPKKKKGGVQKRIDKLTRDKKKEIESALEDFEQNNE